MKRIVAVCLPAVLYALISASALSQCPSTCTPACGQGQSCCVMQYSNGTYSCPYCKSGSCYTSTSKLSLKDTKELDLSALKESTTASKQEPAEVHEKSTAAASSCNPPCGQGQSCCVMQYSNGTYSAPYCKTGSCYTSATKLKLSTVKELDLSSLKEKNVVTDKTKKDQRH